MPIFHLHCKRANWLAKNEKTANFDLIFLAPKVIFKQYQYFAEDLGYLYIVFYSSQIRIMANRFNTTEF